MRVTPFWRCRSASPSDYGKANRDEYFAEMFVDALERLLVVKTRAGVVDIAGDGEIHRGLSNSLAGTQHERKARRARGDREPIGALHLGCAQDFHAESPIYSPVTQAYPFSRGVQLRKFA